MNDLPDTIALFPLWNTVLLPNCILPLHVFEPRYRSMINDVMEDSKVIGMIQPFNVNSLNLVKVGCLGKLENCRKLKNGNFMIRLQGIHRFQIEEEMPQVRPYRMARVRYYDVGSDAFGVEPDRSLEDLFVLLKDYIKHRGIQLNVEKLREIPEHQLVNILCMNLELTAMEKQALLESPDIHTRYDDLVTLLRMNTDLVKNETETSITLN